MLSAGETVEPVVALHGRQYLVDWQCAKLESRATPRSICICFGEGLIQRPRDCI